MDFGTPLVADAQAAELAEPGQRPLYDPPEPAQSVLLGPAAPGNPWLNASASELGPDVARVVSLVGYQRAGTLAGATTACGGPPDRRHGVNQFQHYLSVIGVGRGQLDRQRNALAIRQKVAFGARLGPVGGIRTRLRPPKRARTEAESATAREKSIWSAPPRRSRSARCSLSQTPAFCQSLRRRQQVMPLPQPISRGRYSQGIPVRRTNNTPLRHALSGTRGRPPLGLGGWGGSNGSMAFHRSSGRIGLGKGGNPSRVGDAHPCPKPPTPKSRFC